MFRTSLTIFIPNIKDCYWIYLETFQSKFQHFHCLEFFQRKFQYFHCWIDHFRIHQSTLKTLLVNKFRERLISICSWPHWLTTYWISKIVFITFGHCSKEIPTFSLFRIFSKEIPTFSLFSTFQSKVRHFHCGRDHFRILQSTLKTLCSISSERDWYPYVQDLTN